MKKKEIIISIIILSLFLICWILGGIAIFLFDFLPVSKFNFKENLFEAIGYFLVLISVFYSIYKLKKINKNHTTSEEFYAAWFPFVVILFVYLLVFM